MQPICSKHRLFLNNVKRQTLAIFGIIVAKSYAIRETTYLLFSCQANICWSSRHVLKTSSTHLQRNNFTSSKTSWRRFQDLSQDVLKTSWKTKNCYAEDVLKTCLEDVLKTLWRQAKYLLGISVSNKSKCVSNKSIFHKSISDKSKANPKCVT